MLIFLQYSFFYSVLYPTIKGWLKALHKIKHADIITTMEAGLKAKFIVCPGSVVLLSRR